MELREWTEEIVASCFRIILSNPAGDGEQYRKIIIQRKESFLQFEKYTQTQVFHENVQAGEAVERIVQWMTGHYRQLNGFDEEYEHMLRISRKGVPSYKRKRCAAAVNAAGNKEHDRKKQYLLPEGQVIPPLADMGIFTAEGRVVRTMYDKYRQINRFLEQVDDVVGKGTWEKLHIVDFGCGKSYLTFVLYYYFTEIRKIPVEIVGLDLKADVIEKCNRTAQKYGYSHLRFKQGDIGGYQPDFPVDMVVTLHACDTATDLALYNAVRWNAKLIFSVPCCQHELNGQMSSEAMHLMLRYGIVKERFAALATDAIRANLLECCGYRTQLLEFVDLSHTPKNILIRAEKRKTDSTEHREKMLREVRAFMEEFGVKPMLYGLLEVDERL